MIISENKDSDPPPHLKFFISKKSFPSTHLFARINIKGANINFEFLYLFSAFKESRGQALRHPLEHVLILIFWDKWVPEEPVPMPHAKR